ncbi:MAG: hypothetical protein ACFB6S_15540 [Geminicoccaceae bacterium]
MNGERYQGERRGLRLFLEGLLPSVEKELGRSSLLFHRIRAALKRGDLHSLRDARQMFNHQDSALKRRLSLPARLGPRQDFSQERRPVHDRDGAHSQPYVVFSRDQDSASKTRVEYRFDPVDNSALQVMIEPGTLPKTAAEELRNIADAIESDRAILSNKHWLRRHHTDDDVNSR